MPILTSEEISLYFKPGFIYTYNGIFPQTIYSLDNLYSFNKISWRHIDKCPILKDRENFLLIEILGKRKFLNDIAFYLKILKNDTVGWIHDYFLENYKIVNDKR